MKEKEEIKNELKKLFNCFNNEQIDKLIDKKVENLNIIKTLRFGEYDKIEKNLDRNNKLDEVNGKAGIYIILNCENNLEFDNDSKIFKEVFKTDIYGIEDRYEQLKKCDDKKCRIIYIGKATNLKLRIKQYLVPKVNHSGGRTIWKIKQVDNLRIIWITLDEINKCFENFKYNYPEVLETTLLQNYRYNNNPKNTATYTDSVLPLANNKSK